MTPAKINLKEFFSAASKIYVDSSDNTLWTDLAFFFALPMILAGAFSYFTKVNADIAIIYTSVAFLSGFVFSAFILLLNILPMVRELEDGPKKTALETNVREITLIALLIFYMGLIVLLAGLLDLFLSNSIYDCLAIGVYVPRFVSVACFISMIFHLLMLIKRLFVTLTAT